MGRAFGHLRSCVRRREEARPVVLVPRAWTRVVPLTDEVVGEREIIIKRRLADLRALRPADLTVTASIGVSAQGSQQIMGFDQLFKIADEAVYAAKQIGRNSVVSTER